MGFEIDAAVGRRLEAWGRRRGVKPALRWFSRLLLLVPLVWLGLIGQKLLAATPPSPLPTANPATRFGLAEAERMEIYRNIVGHEAQWRRQAERRFPGDAWSQADDYHAFVAQHVLRVARTRRLHYSVVYLILDEGVRRGWTAADGTKIRAVPVPLRPRIH